MAYLSSAQRKKTILDAAQAIALREGLSSVTVRKVATELEISVGQIHHHFSSINELKSESFKEIAKKTLITPKKSENENWKEYLINFLYVEYEEYDYFLSLFREVRTLAKTDALMKSAYVETLKNLQSIVVSIIEYGQEEKNCNCFNLSDSPENIALRLLAFTVGLDDFLGLGFVSDDKKHFKDNLNKIVNAELNDMCDKHQNG